jgi:phosphonate transport system substrate-binding protein
MSVTRHRAAATAAAALLTVALAACGESAASNSGGDDAADPDTLVFAAIPAEESASLQESYQPVIDMLEDETGKTVEFRQATDYAAVIEGQLAGKIHIAQYGPLSFVLAQKEGADITPAAAYIDAEGEEPGYTSYGITRPGSGIDSIEDFAGKTICFVEPNSTSGYLYPTAGLIEAGIDPESGITPVFAGSHDASVLEVAAGRCDAGFAFDSMVDTQLIETGALEAGAVTKVWESDVIPGSPVAISNSLSPELRETLAAAFADHANTDHLLANGYCEGACPVGDEDSWGYTAVDDAFYDAIREVCETTQNENCTEQ